MIRTRKRWSEVAGKRENSEGQQARERQRKKKMKMEEEEEEKFGGSDPMIWKAHDWRKGRVSRQRELETQFECQSLPEIKKPAFFSVVYPFPDIRSGSFSVCSSG